MKTSARSITPPGVPSNAPHGGRDAAMALLPPRVRAAASAYHQQNHGSSLEPLRQRRGF
jgi:hypothetical protein